VGVGVDGGVEVAVGEGGNGVIVGVGVLITVGVGGAAVGVAGVVGVGVVPSTETVATCTCAICPSSLYALTCRSYSPGLLAVH